MQSHTGRRAIVIGGGIGGMTTAIALQQAGMNVMVFEQADAVREVGSGLPLWSNALRALHQLGLSNMIETLGQSVTARCVTNWNGDVLVDVSTEALLKELGTVNIVVHRAELLSALLNTLGSEHVYLGTTCVGFTQDATGVCARFADGKEVRGDMLVGADGLHSRIRSQMFRATRPHYSGYTCWRGIVHTTRKDIETWAWGKGYQFGITPMSKDRAYWFAQRYAPEGEPDKPGGRKSEVLGLFHDWHDPIPDIIETTDEASILRNDVYEGKLLSHWSRGRVTLLGDAAHTMTPNLGQGACIAIEDAVELSVCLEATTDVHRALRDYEARRIGRANRITWLAGLIGKTVQQGNPLVSGMRNALLKKVPTHVSLQQLMWILAYDVKSSK